MRNLHQAIRSRKKAIGQAADTGTHSPEQKAFLRSLLDFERYNRGHQHMLDSALDPKCSADGNRKRMLGARDHLSWLLTAFSQLSQADWPNIEGLAAIIDTACPSGALATMTLQRLQSFAAMECKLPDGIRLSTGATLFQGGELRMTMTLTSRDGRLQATRQLMLTCAEPSTLREARLALRDAKRALRKLLSDATSWPEFSAATRDAKTLDSAKQSLRRFLQTLPADERAQLSAHWTALRPY